MFFELIGGIFVAIYRCMCVFLLTDLGESILLRVLVVSTAFSTLGEEEVDEVCQQVGLKTLAPSGAPGINPAMISRQEKLSGGRRRWGGFM